jgi:predicted MFS family arabinose efflux permease/HAMP domain-containing protein
MKKLHVRLVVLVTVMLALSALLLSWFALRHFREELPPQMARTVAAVSNSAAGVMEKAYEYGVPLDKMVGTEEFLAVVRKDNPDIAYILVSDAHDRILFQSGFSDLAERPDLELDRRTGTDIVTETVGAYYNTSVPLVFKHQWVGTLHLGQPSVLVRHKLQDVAWDVVTVLVVAGLIALELLRFVLTFVIATPAAVTGDFLERVRQGDFRVYLPDDRLAGIGQLSERLNAIVARINERYLALQTGTRDAAAGMRDRIATRLAGLQFHGASERTTLFAAALDHIRWPFFLLIFADSLSLSFFPVFVGQFYSPSFGLSKSVVVGLPISIFMFTWALSMPWAGSLSDRVGHRKAFIIGAAITTVGLVLTANAQSLWDLLAWRSLTALGYGLVFITTQSYVTNNTPPQQRTRGMAVFLSSFFAGSLAGSAIGGILSDRLGYQVTILFSGLLSATAALFVLRFLRTNPHQSALKKKLTVRDFKLLLKNKKFVGITFLAAVPAKIALTGFLYYAVPLYLKMLGNNQSTTGRIMMAYGLAIIALSPFVAKLADRVGKLGWFISVGGYSSALAMFIVYYFDSTPGLLVSVTLLGIAHSIGVSPQMPLINDLCKDVVQEVGAGTVTGIFRLIERLGNVLGPIISGLLISRFGFTGAFLGIGLLSLVCITCFSTMFYWFGRTGARSASTGL